MIIIISATAIASGTRTPTNINNVTDLFNKEIDDRQELEQLMTNAQAQANQSIANKEGLQALAASESEAEQKTSELNAINANNLADAGNNERSNEEHNYYDSLEVDYSSPQIINHIKDVDLIAAASERLMSRLIEGLRQLDVDCKQVQGNKEIEPAYYLDLQKEHLEDTIYQQHFCEQLRNNYNCADKLTLSCNVKGMKYGEWQARTIEFGGLEIRGTKNWFYLIHWKKNRNGCHMKSDPKTMAEVRAAIAQKLAVELGQISEHIDISARGIEPTMVTECGDIFVFSKYIFGYKYRDGALACLEWREIWDEACTLQ